MSNDPHDAAFFEQMRSCREPYRRLADCVHDVVGGQPNCLDIGCGIGLQTARLRELGWDAIGAEYSPFAIEMIEPGVEVAPFDLTQEHGGAGWVTYCFSRGLGAVDESGQWAERDAPKFSCVICTETAEHIPAEHANAIVRNVASLATDVIVWSAAAPGQEWEGHINLQRPEYWLKRFRMLGWDLDDDKTAKLRYLMSKHNAQHVLGKENFCVLKKVGRPLHMTIISTALNAEKWIRKHIESVSTQTFRNFDHVIIDAMSEDATYHQAVVGLAGSHHIYRNETRKAALENCYEAWKDLPDDEVVVWLDGDDWLAHDQALEVIAHAYCSANEPWLTFGQFMMTNGEIGFAQPYPPGANARFMDWRATHLKTFRAGLVKKLAPEMLQLGGEWISLAIDKAVMWPLLEMAGDRYTCVREIVSVYNLNASWWAAQTPASREEELAWVERIRHSQPQQHRLTKRPW